MRTHNQFTEKSGLLNQSIGQLHYNVNVELFSQSCYRTVKPGNKAEKVKMKKSNHLSGINPKLLMIRTFLILLLLLAGINVSWAQEGPYPNTGDQPVCLTGVQEPYGVIPTLGSIYEWTVDGALTSPNWILHSNGTNLASILWITPGTYTVRVVETIIATECIGAIVPINVTVNHALAAPTATNQSHCEQSPIQTLTAVASPPAGSSVVWYDAATGGNIVTSPTLNSVGSVTYYAQSVLSPGGCTSLTRTAVTLTIIPAPVPEITGPNSVCQSINGLTEVYNTDSTGNTLVWTVVGGSFTGQGTNQIIVTWTTAGPGSVSITETFAATGCSATDTILVNVQTAPVTSPIYHN